MPGGDVIIKESQNIVKDFLGTIAKKVNFRERPFETIFGALGPALLWKMFGGKVGLLVYLLDGLNLGFGRLGRWIDEELNWKPGQNLSTGALKSASVGVIDKIKRIIGLKASSMLQDIMEVKGTIDERDLITVACALKYFPQTIKKQAIGRKQYFKRFLAAIKGGKKMGFASILYGILKLFVGGLVGLGLVGVAGGLARKYLSPEIPEIPPVGAPSPLRLPSTGSGIFGGPSKAPGATPAVSGGNLLILNEKRNVEDTLINFLDSTIEGFSRAFRQVKKRPLKGSSEMRGRLAVIEKINRKKIWDLNRESSFVIPPIILIANSLLPEAKYEKIKKPAPAAAKKAKSAG